MSDENKKNSVATSAPENCKSCTGMLLYVDMMKKEKKDPLCIGTRIFLYFIVLFPQLLI